ncbi:MAG TPA: flavin reductase family protein [Nocardioidaceae bacterium]|nr:flavin reductase family protein [Nocardioidaceae bacterium]
MRTDFFVDDPEVNPYRLLTAVVVPRPIAWVSTVSASGVVNLAPHSFYTVACARPPIVQFTSVRKKDTLRNVLETGEFVVNLAPAPLLAEVNNSAARFAPDQSEPDALGIAMEPSATVRPPRVTASPVAIECTLHSTNELGDSTLVLGDVRMISVAEEVLVDGHPEYARLDPLARLGKEEWALHAEVVSVVRPVRPEDIRS